MSNLIATMDSTTLAAHLIDSMNRTDDLLALDPMPRAAAVAHTFVMLADTVDRGRFAMAPVVHSLASECRPRGADKETSYVWKSVAALADDLGISAGEARKLNRLGAAIDAGLTRDHADYALIASGVSLGEWDGFDTLAAWEDACAALRAAEVAAAEASRTLPSTAEATTTDAPATDAPAPVEAAPVEEVEVEARAAQPDIAAVDPRRSPVDALDLIVVEVASDRVSKRTRRELAAAIQRLESALAEADARG